MISNFNDGDNNLFFMDDLKLYGKNDHEQLWTIENCQTIQ